MQTAAAVENIYIVLGSRVGVVELELVAITAQKQDLSFTMSAVEVQSEYSLEKLSPVRHAHHHTDELVRFIVVHSVNGLDVFLNQARASLVDKF